MVFNNSTTATFYSTTYFADSTDNSLYSPHIEEQSVQPPKFGHLLLLSRVISLFHFLPRIRLVAPIRKVKGNYF
ncbi:hypothetical protein LC085_18780, partial [Bacillus tianshenii]|uniref:hypothetical protein n=1 Tax=Sutcliffiella tianshenii TaxID=1463404 RepID=UPI001CD62961